jgi:protein ImuB
VLGWAGPWPVEERWWDPDGGRRRARLQVTIRTTSNDDTDAGQDTDRTGLLLACENSRWHVEGIYD